MVRCAACGTRGATQYCGACRYTQYCNPVCQREHWKAGHKQECKSYRAVAPLPAHDIRRLPLPALVDFIWSPGVLIEDAAKVAAQSLLRRHTKRALSKKLSLRALKGFLNIVERLYTERVCAVEGPCAVIYELLDPDSAKIFLREGGLSVLVQALRVALTAPPRASAAAEEVCSTSARAEHGMDSGCTGYDAPCVCACAESAHDSVTVSSVSSSDEYLSKADSVAVWLLDNIEYLVDHSGDVCGELLVHDGAHPIIVSALRTLSRKKPRFYDSSCNIISLLAAIDDEYKSSFVASGAVPVLLSTILESKRVAPTSAFRALSRLLEPSASRDPAIADAARYEQERIVDTIFYALTINLCTFDKDDEEDVEVLTHAGDMFSSIAFHLSFGQTRGTRSVDGAVNATIASVSALLYGDDEPDRLPALVNALRASTHGIADIDDSARLAGAFAMAISIAIDGAGWASCRNTVEAGAIPALLTALRKHGESSLVLVSTAAAALRKLQLSAREGCCSERIASELSMRGTTPKLLRRLRDVWRAKAAAASDAASYSADAISDGTDTQLLPIVNELTALLADMPVAGHA